jgi:hypothetical protein
MFHPDDSLISQPDVIIVSNKRPIQVYSNKVLKKFRLENFTTVRLVGAGGAVNTALRVARFVVEVLKAEVGWTAVSEVVNEIPVVLEMPQIIPAFGEIPDLNSGVETRSINQVTVQIRLVKK